MSNPITRPKKKKLVLFSDIGRVNFFFITHPPAQSNVSQHTDLSSKNKQNKKQGSKKQMKLMKAREYLWKID